MNQSGERDPQGLGNTEREERLLLLEPKMDSMKTALHVEIHLQERKHTAKYRKSGRRACLKHSPNGLHLRSVKVLGLQRCIHSKSGGSGVSGSSTSETRARVRRSSARRGVAYGDPILLEVKGPFVPTRICWSTNVRCKAEVVTGAHGVGTWPCFEVFYLSECPGHGVFDHA